MAVDAAHQQPYDPVAALTRYHNQRNNTAEVTAHSSQRRDPPKDDSLRTSKNIRRAFTSWFKEDDYAVDEQEVDEAIRI